MDAPPTGFPIHQKPDGNWYVSMDGTDDWTLCRDEAEALLLAMSPTLLKAALDKTREGEDFAEDLELTADAFARHRRADTAREFRDLATTARKRATAQTR